MDLISPKTIKELLSKHKTMPSKGLGQNFLIDKNILNKIITASELKSDDFILEIGPGIGTLTQELAKNAGKVVAVEKSAAMCEILKETLANFKNIEIINADALKIWSFENYLKIEKLKIKNYKVVANIPYYLTSPLIRLFLETQNPPKFMVLMLQKEVAQRICANPPDMSLLSVSVQFYADPKIISYVSKNCFLPAPKVDSAIIKITPFKADRLPMSIPLDRHRKSICLFFRIVKAGFSQPRKQIAGNLSKSLKIPKEQTTAWLSKNNIDPKQRAETLSISDWKNLSKSFNF